MSDTPSTTSESPCSPVRIDVACVDLDAAIAFYTETLDFRLDMIMPADSPRVAVVSGYGIAVHLAIDDDRPAPTPGSTGGQEPMLAICRADDSDAWVEGRAGMQYRDLVPGRLGGRVIASHIRITKGGPVPDYVHYHQVGFQMIFCRRGWVRVVYEDQGPPFVMHAGDCVLQPPTIRHRVLEASPGLEVIEIGCPAEHPTFRDHALQLPTTQLRPERDFGGQRFVRHVAADASWQHTAGRGLEFRDTGIHDATGGLASVRIVRTRTDADPAVEIPCPVTSCIDDVDIVILSVLDGCLTLHGDASLMHLLEPDDTCLIPAGVPWTLQAGAPSQWLEVVISGKA